METEDLFRRFGRESPRGTVLFREGDPGGGMYVIQQGQVSISARAGSVERVLSTLGPGEFFGEMSILNGAPRSATATCLEDCRLLVVDGPTFEAMIRQNGEIAARVIRTLASRLADANRQIEILMLGDVRARVIHFLATAAERAGAGPIDGTGAEAMARTLGVAPDRVREVVAALEHAGLVTAGPDGVQVPQPGRLRSFLDLLQEQERFPR